VREASRDEGLAVDDQLTKRPDVACDSFCGLTRELDPDAPAQRRRQLTPSTQHGILGRCSPAVDLNA